MRLNSVTLGVVIETSFRVQAVVAGESIRRRRHGKPWNETTGVSAVNRVDEGEGDKVSIVTGWALDVCHWMKTFVFLHPHRHSTFPS